MWVLNQWCRACALLLERHVTGIHPLFRGENLGGSEAMRWGNESTSGLLSSLTHTLTHPLFLWHRMPSPHPIHTHTPREARFLKRPTLVDVVRVMRARAESRDRDGYIFFSRFPSENTSKIRKSDSIPTWGSIHQIDTSKRPIFASIPREVTVRITRFFS